MKNVRVYLILYFIFTGMAAYAVRAEGSWHTVTQSDGTEIEVRLCGDEWLHCFVTRDGVPLLEDELTGDFCYADVFGFGMKSSGIIAHEAARRTSTEQMHVRTLADVDAVQPYIAARRQQAPRRAMLQPTHHVGEYRGLLILATFPDQSFHSETPVDDYLSILNVPGYRANELSMGSVHDYFRAQSHGLFNLTFDVFGPYEVKDGCHEYGSQSKVRTEMMKELLDSLRKEDVDMAPYDWDDDGEVDQVIVIYAGYGSNEYYSNNEKTNKAKGCIWPFEWDLGTAVTVGNRKIYTFAIINELTVYNDSYSGIGTICHEFSHCLGLPDMYDTHFSTAQSSTGGIMDTWELMDGGNYSNRGWCPPNYSAFERAYCGWIEPEVLTADTVISAMTALSDTSTEAYKIINECNGKSVDEYYLLENRQKNGWDLCVPGHGLLVWHIDYSANVWMNNRVNDDINHLRCIAVCADNQPMKFYTGMKKMTNSAYPFFIDSVAVMNNALTDTTIPAAAVFNTNIQGNNLMGKPIKGITEYSNGTISFRFYNSNLETGDVNNDRKVNVGDIMAVINTMADTSGQAYKDTSTDADVNGDGNVNVGDIMAVINLMASKVEGEYP